MAASENRGSDQSRTRDQAATARIFQSPEYCHIQPTFLGQYHFLLDYSIGYTPWGKDPGIPGDQTDCSPRVAEQL